MTQPKIALGATDSTQSAFASVGRRLSNLEKTAGGVAKQFGSLGTLLAGSLAGATVLSAIRNTANLNDEMGKLAQRAGDTTEAVSALAYAAKLSDVDNQQLAKGLRELGNDAASGGEKLKKLGIDLLDGQGKAKTSSQLFSEVADRIAGIENPAQRAAVAAKIFGDRVGPELLPLLNSGSAGIKSMTDEAARFGRVVSDEAATKAAEFNDNLTRLQERTAGIAQQLAGPLVAGLATASSYFLKVAGDVGIARAALISFGGAVARTLGVDDVGQLQSQARANQNAIALTVKQIENFQRLADRGVAGAADRVNKLREQYSKLQQDGQRITQSLKGEADSITQGAVSPQGTALPKIDVAAVLADGKPPRPPKPTAAKDPFAEAQRYLEGLQRQLEGTQKLTEVEQVLRDLQLGRLGKVSEAQRQAILNIAAEIDASKEFEEIQKEFKKLEEEAIDRKRALADAGKRVYEETRTPLEQLNIELAELQRLLDAGAISFDTFARKSFMLEEALNGAKEEISELDKFAQRAAENIQDALGNSFADILDGNFKDIGKSFTSLINKMVAEAAAAQISRYLFGDLVGGGSGGGAVGGVFKDIIGGLFGGIPQLDTGTDYVPRDMLAVIHKGEKITPAAQNRPGAGGGVNNNYITVQMPSGASRSTAMQFGAEAAKQLGRANSRNG